MIHYTAEEFDLASKLYSEHAGYDIANRLPLRCRDPWHQRQWCAVARLATVLVTSAAASKLRGCTCHPDEAPTPCQRRYAFSECVAAAELAQRVTVAFPAPLEIPSPPIAAATVLR